MKHIRIMIIVFTSFLAIQSASVSSATDAPEASPSGGLSGSISSFGGESFETDLTTGAATMSVPITVPPGRKNMQPKLAISYSSNNSNGICGMGWAIPSNLIQRSTKTGNPRYDSTDTFVFMSSGANAELVSIGEGEYKAKIEGAFMKYLYDTSLNTWTVYDKAGTKYTFGASSLSRQEKNVLTFAWFLDRIEDVYGNFLTYIYDKPADGQVYLKEIHYTGGPSLDADKKVVFNYTDDRTDKLYSNRAGWSISTSRLLSSIYVYHQDNIVWRYELAYEASEDTSRNLMQSITVYNKHGESLPPKTFTYQRLD